MAPFACPCRPFTFNFHSSCATGCVVAKAAPLPVFRAFAQTALYRVSMDVAKLLHKLRVVPDVEIVIALLPEVCGFADQAAGDALF